MASKLKHPNYKAGEIVLVKYSENLVLHSNQYIGYVKHDLNGELVLPLINRSKDLNGHDSRSGFKSLDLRLDSIVERIVLKRGVEVETPIPGELYEAQVDDPYSGSISPGECEGTKYSLVGCYFGILGFHGHNYFMFSNVCETDPEKLKLRSKDPTDGRRIFNRIRRNENLVIRKLIKKTM